MKRSLEHTAIRNFSWAALVIVLGGCDGGNGGPAAPTPRVPVISNLVPTFGSSPCTTRGGGSGTPLFLAVDYSDSDGDEQGGTLRTRATFQPSGISSVLDFGLPSTRAQITGTTEGTITVQGCISFGPATGATMEVALLDKGGHFSNILSSHLNRPAGAPEARRGDEGRWGTEERLHQ